jgi:hypothetical protein
VHGLSVPAPDLFCADFRFFVDLRMGWASGPEALFTLPCFCVSSLFAPPLFELVFNYFSAYLKKHLFSQWLI